MIINDGSDIFIHLEKIGRIKTSGGNQNGSHTFQNESDIVQYPPIILSTDLLDRSQMIINKFKKNSQISPITSTSVAGLRMEKLKCPPFEGDCRKYPRFKEQFVRHIKPLYHVDQETFTLRSYLNDTVREDIEALGEDVEAAWARLDAKYGDEGKLIALVMSEIKRMNPASDKHPKTVLEIIATI